MGIDYFFDMFSKISREEKWELLPAKKKRQNYELVGKVIFYAVERVYGTWKNLFYESALNTLEQYTPEKWEEIMEYHQQYRSLCIASDIAEEFNRTAKNKGVEAKAIPVPTAGIRVVIAQITNEEISLKTEYLS